MKQTKQYLLIAQHGEAFIMQPVDLPYNTRTDDAPCIVERAELTIAALNNFCKYDEQKHSPDLWLPLTNLSVQDVIAQRYPPSFNVVIVDVSYLEHLFSIQPQ